MNLKFQDRYNRFNPLLEEKIEVDGKTKNVTVKNFGSFPDSIQINSPENKALLRNIVKTVQTLQKEEFLESNLSDKELVKLLNSQSDQSCQTVQLGVALVNKALNDFHLDRLFKELQESTKRGYDLKSYFTFIVSHQIIRPGSLLYYYNTSPGYSVLLPERVIKLQDLYDFLTFFYPHHLEFQKVIFETTVKLLGRQKVHIFYYDGTNFTCWSTEADPEHFDRLDEEVKEGLRQFGHAKSKRNDKLLVSLGVIATNLEIPLFYSVFPGNRQEITYIKNDVTNLNHSLLNLNLNIREIITADAGLHSGDLEYWLSGSNNYLRREGAGYIIGRSINKVDEKTRKWALNSKGYVKVPDDPEDEENQKEEDEEEDEKITRVKSRVITTEVDVKLKDGRKVKKPVRLKQVCVYSEKREFKALEVLNHNVEKLRKLQEKPKKFKRYLKRKLGKYLDVLGIFNETGEVTKEFLAFINGEAVEEEMDKAGLFIIETSETDWPDGKILQCYREKFHIEHLIRTLKSVLEASPAYVYTYEHIISHYELCTIALTVLNYIKIKYTKTIGFDISAERIQLALDQFNAFSIRSTVLMIPDICEDTQLLMKTFDIELENNFETSFKIKKLFGLK